MESKGLFSLLNRNLKALLWFKHFKKRKILEVCPKCGKKIEGIPIRTHTHCYKEDILPIPEEERGKEWNKLKQEAKKEGVNILTHCFICHEKLSTTPPSPADKMICECGHIEYF